MLSNYAKSCLLSTVESFFKKNENLNSQLLKRRIGNKTKSKFLSNKTLTMAQNVHIICAKNKKN